MSINKTFNFYSNRTSKRQNKYKFNHFDKSLVKFNPVAK